MKIIFSLLLHSLISSDGVSARRGKRGNMKDPPKQGVFLNANQPNNQIGVWESLSDGSLLWRGRYDTGGVGYPDPLDAENLDDLGSSNSVHYHVFNDKQYLLAVNGGGPQNDPSISIFEIEPDLELVLKDTVPTQGTFPCSIAGYADRACVATCAFNSTLECFHINPDDSTLMPEYHYDFEMGLPAPTGRPNRVSAALGIGNIAFSPDGKAIGAIVKGTSVLSDDEGNHENAQAGLHVFVTTEDDSSEMSRYADPIFQPLPNEAIPFAFTWRRGASDDELIAMSVNIAGESLDFPECDENIACYSSITSILVDLSQEVPSISKAFDVALGNIDGCWIDYFDGYVYTGNFFSDSITSAETSSSGEITVKKETPIGADTIPNDIVVLGQKLDNSLFIYSENQGTEVIGVHQIIDKEYIKVLPSAPVPTGRTPDAWKGNNGLAATTLSEYDLFEFYDYKPKKK
jgi:hypothetical protein